MGYKRIGIIGAGVIGKAVFDAIADSGLAEVVYVLDPVPAAMPPDDRRRALLVTDPSRALATAADLVIEAAHPSIIAQYGTEILGRSALCAFSCTALADSATETAIRRAAVEARTRLYIPHGAILALDGISDGRDAIDEVIVTTTKSGASLGIDAEAHGIVFQGPTREACARFPRNVNVHAAIAIAGIGFDKTRSVVVADPNTKDMQHRIEVAGQGFKWDIGVRSTSLGGVSGAYTPRSAAGSIQRILGLHPITTC